MNYQYLAADQQETSLFSTTDFERTRDLIGRTVANAARADGTYRSTDYRKSDVEHFLRLYMQVSRKQKETMLTAPWTISLYIFNNWGPERRMQMVKYTDEFKRMAQAGQVPESILKPWTYEKPAGGDFKDTADKAVKTMIYAGVAGLVVYGLVMSSPKLIYSFSKA